MSTGRSGSRPSASTTDRIPTLPSVTAIRGSEMASQIVSAYVGRRAQACWTPSRESMRARRRVEVARMGTLSACRLKEFNQIARRVLGKDLLAPRPHHNLISEMHTVRAQAGDL